LFGTFFICEEHLTMNLWKTPRAKQRDFRGWVGMSVDMRTGKAVVLKSKFPRLNNRIWRVKNPGYDGDSVA